MREARMTEVPPYLKDHYCIEWPKSFTYSWKSHLDYIGEGSWWLSHSGWHENFYQLIRIMILPVAIFLYIAYVYNDFSLVRMPYLPIWDEWTLNFSTSEVSIGSWNVFRCHELKDNQDLWCLSRCQISFAVTHSHSRLYSFISITYYFKQINIFFNTKIIMMSLTYPDELQHHIMYHQSLGVNFRLFGHKCDL